MGYRQVRRSFNHAANGQRQRAYPGRGSFHCYFSRGHPLRARNNEQISPGHSSSIPSDRGCRGFPVALNTGLFWGRRQFLKHPGKMTIQFLPPCQAASTGNNSCHSCNLPSRTQHVIWSKKPSIAIFILIMWKTSFIVFFQWFKIL